MTASAKPRTAKASASKTKRPASAPAHDGSPRGVAAVRRSLDAIERENGDLNAFLIVTADRALAEATAQ